MKEFIEKLIGRLEEQRGHICNCMPCNGCKYIGDCNEGEFAEDVALDKAIEIVNQLAEEMGVSKMENTTWIPCDERLPRIGEQVMVCNTFGSVFVSHITYLNPRVDIHGRCHDFGSHYNVIAWQPLPAPYKPKE